MARERGLPSAALLPHLECAARRREYVTEWHHLEGGWSRLAEDLADRLGMTPQSIARQLARIRRGCLRLELRTADRLATALGLHPALVWGDEWWLYGEGNPQRARDREARQRRALGLELAAAGDEGW